jgi:hypothetical protein
MQAVVVVRDETRRGVPSTRVDALEADAPSRFSGSPSAETKADPMAVRAGYRVSDRSAERVGAASRRIADGVGRIGSSDPRKKAARIWQVDRDVRTFRTF